MPASRNARAADGIKYFNIIVHEILYVKVNQCRLIELIPTKHLAPSLKFKVRSVLTKRHSNLYIKFYLFFILLALFKK